MDAVQTADTVKLLRGSPSHCDHCSSPIRGQHMCATLRSDNNTYRFCDVAHMTSFSFERLKGEMWYTVWESGGD